MEQVRGLKFQSGDDISITINISTECVPMDLSLYNAFWELRPAMTGDSLINKTSAGDWPTGVTPDIVIDTTASTVTVYLTSGDTAPLFGEYWQYLYLQHKTTYKKTSIIKGPIFFGEGPDSEYATVTYCTPEDITEQLDLLNEDGSRLLLTETSVPTRSQVVKYIRDAETQIDRITKDSWRENTVTNEYHDIRFPLEAIPRKDVVVSLDYRNIRTIDPDQGDKVEFWDGSTWQDYADEEQIRGSTWWVDYNDGLIHFNDMWPWYNTGREKVRVTYRWGASTVPEDIRQVCVKMVSIRLLQSQFNKIFLMNSHPAVDWKDVIEYWKEDNELILATRTRKIWAICQR